MMTHTLFLKIASGTLDISPLPFNDAGTDHAQSAWKNGLSIVLGISAAVALLMIVINGFQYITASGDPQKTAQARMGLLYSIIGLLVVLFAAAIVTAAIKGVT